MDLYNLNNISSEEVSSLQLISNSRTEIKSKIDKTARFDVLVVGGGIHGAAFARLAALNGLTTLLLEENDYAHATSSRSSKMAHGGLRYLELFDLAQVREGVRAREDFFEIAPHLVYPHPFLVPVSRGDYWTRIKLGVALWFYDQIVKNKSRKHSWIPSTSDLFTSFNKDQFSLSGAYQYYDGLMNDTRMVLDNIIAARQEGALCLNHARFETYNHRKDNRVSFSWRDTLNNTSHEGDAGIVVNCAGPWVPAAGRLRDNELAQHLIYSRGSHLLFSKRWNGPAMIIPLGGRGRYYFVWPHPSGTMVGTTERLTQKPESDPLPNEDEIKELMTQVRRDVSPEKIGDELPFYGFAGIRTLPLRGNTKDPSQVSRKHIWHYSGGMLSLLGGKFTTANWTVLEGLKKVYSLSGISKEPVGLMNRKLPGAFILEDSIRDFNEFCRSFNLSDTLRDSCVRRLGGRVRFLQELDPSGQLISSEVLKADLDFALQVEQAETLEDIMKRRLDLEFTVKHGLDSIDAICLYLKEKRPEIDWLSQAENYKKRVLSVKELISKTLNA